MLRCTILHPTRLAVCTRDRESWWEITYVRLHRDAVCVAVQTPTARSEKLTPQQQASRSWRPSALKLKLKRHRRPALPWKKANGSNAVARASAKGTRFLPSMTSSTSLRLCGACLAANGCCPNLPPVSFWRTGSVGRTELAAQRDRQALPHLPMSTSQTRAPRAADLAA